MMQQMRGRIFWEGMNNEAKELIRICNECQVNADLINKTKQKYPIKTCSISTQITQSM